MAEPSDPSDPSGVLRGLLRDGDEINFLADEGADPSIVPAFQAFVEEAQGRIRSSAEKALLIHQQYLDAGKPFGLLLRTFEREAYRYGIAEPGGEMRDDGLWRVAGRQSVERR